MTNSATPLDAADLGPILSILEDPENPAFAQALARLDTLDLSTLKGAITPQLLAQLQNVITKLSDDKTLTGQQLSAIRRGNSALKSYNNIK